MVISKRQNYLVEIEHETDDIGVRLEGVGDRIGFLERTIKGDVFASQEVVRFQDALRDCAYNFHAINIDNKHIGKLIAKLEKAGPKVEVGEEKRALQVQELASLNERYRLLMVDLLGSAHSKIFGEDYSKIPDAIRSGLISPNQADKFNVIIDDVERRIESAEKLLSIDDVFFGDLGSFHPKLQNRFLTLGETAHVLTSAYQDIAPKHNTREGVYAGIEPLQNKVQFGGVEVSVKSIRIDKVAVYPQKTDAVLNSLEEAWERIEGDRSKMDKLANQYHRIVEERNGVREKFGQYINGLKVNELVTYQDTVGYEDTVKEIDALLEKNPWLKTDEESGCLKYRSFRGRWSSIRGKSEERTGVINEFKAILNNAPSVRISSPGWRVREAEDVLRQADRLIDVNPWLKNISGYETGYVGLKRDIQKYYEC